MNEKFDVAIVGAGPSGCAAAYSLAKEGFQVLLVERGKYAGSKNLMGGRMYTHALNRLIPDFWKSAPVERYVINETLNFLTEDSSISFEFKSQKLGGKIPNSFTLLRAKFDQWFASKAEEAGAMLIPNIRVDDILWESGKVSGIVAGTDQLQSDVVIVADGAVSLLAEKAGLKKEFKPSQYGIGIKEVIELPRETIEDRFNLEGEEGSANLFIGHCTKSPSIRGGGFLYTNKNSLSLGIVALIDQIMEKKIEFHSLIEDFKLHPKVKNLIKDGKVVEYSAHALPEYINLKPQLYTDGLMVVGDAAGFVLNNGFTQRGMDFAIASGIAAAETVKFASEKGDFSKQTLSYYEKLLNQSFVLKDLNTFKNAPNFLENPRLYSIYPKLACGIFENIFKVDGTPKKRILDTVRKEMKNRINILILMKDLINGVRSI
ncbi:MAG: FAD-dependent oxidoreductase [Methanosarcinales archaeon]